MKHKLYCIVGKSASGKDTVFKHLLDFVPTLRPYISYTTRAKREGEVEGKQYHFVTKEFLQRADEDDNVIEARYYNTKNNGKVWYATLKDQVYLDESDYLMVITPSAVEAVQKAYGKNNVVIIYIQADDRDRLLRSLSRQKNASKDDCLEICRRFLADEIDFGDIVVPDDWYCYVNSDIYTCVADILYDLFPSSLEDFNNKCP